MTDTMIHGEFFDHTPAKSTKWRKKVKRELADMAQNEKEKMKGGLIEAK